MTKHKERYLRRAGSVASEMTRDLFDAQRSDCIKNIEFSAVTIFMKFVGESATFRSA